MGGQVEMYGKALRKRLWNIELELLVVVFCVALAIVFVFDTRQPLEDVHWDSPIWLHAAKGYAETSYLSDLQSCAQTFLSTRDLPGAAKAPDCFFQFSRLGHVIILGELTRLFYERVEAVIAATNFYRGTLAISVVLLAWLSVQLHKLLNDFRVDYQDLLGLAFSSFLFIASAPFQYIGSSLVSDVPSYLLVIGACNALVSGITCKSVWRVALSGFLGFIAYVVRLESIISYLLFVVALAGILFTYKRSRFWWQGFFIAGLVALLFYAVYFACFYPLPSPVLYLLNAGQVQGQYQGVHYPFGITFFLKAGGLLWIGCLLWLIFGSRLPLTIFAASWFVLMMVPLAPWLLQQGPTQTRHYLFIDLPLMMLSASGWAAVLDRGISGPGFKTLALGLVSGAFCLGFLSHANAFEWTKGLPGMWRVSQILGLPRIEKVSFPLDEAFKLKGIIYKEQEPTVVFLSRDISREQDYVFLLSYLGPNYRPDVDAINFRKFGPDRGSGEDCSQLLPLPKEESALYYRGDLTEKCVKALRLSGIRVLRLSSATSALDSGPLGETELLSLKTFRLTQIP